MNPELPVEIKPSNRARKLQEGKLRKQKQKAVLKRQRDDEQRWHLEMRSGSQAEGDRGDRTPGFPTALYSSGGRLSNTRLPP